MRLLLDTHILLWAAYDSKRLPPEARDLIGDDANDLFFSAASIWEVAIKAGLARADFGVDAHVLRRELLENGFGELAVSGAHAVAVIDLPAIHRDPIDRMLVAQARLEGITLLTADRAVAAYGAPTRFV